MDAQIIQNNTSINELVQMCTIATNRDVKEIFLKLIGNKLTTDNYTSLNNQLLKEIKDICNQVYSEGVITVFKSIFQNQEGGGCNGSGNNELVPVNTSAGKNYSILRPKPHEHQPSTSQQGCFDVHHNDEQEEMVNEDEPHCRLVNIVVISNKFQFNKKFKVKCSEGVFKFQNVPNDREKFYSYLDDAFNEILKFTTKDALPHYLIGIKISMSNFNDVKPIGINFTAISNVKSSSIASLMESVAQSNSKFLITDAMEVCSVILHIPHGKGEVINFKRAPSQIFLSRKRKSIIDFEINDGIYCLPIAILLGQCITDNDKSKIRRYKRNNNLLMKDVHNLNRLAKVKSDKRFGSSLVQLVSYQDVLSKYNIIVFNDTSDFEKKLFHNPSRTSEKLNINIFYFEDLLHFVAIRNMFFNKRYQCGICLKLFNRKNNHLCSEKCRSCEMTPPCERSHSKINCNECNRYFYGQDCYNTHIHTTCSILRFCKICARLIDMRKRDYKEHNCDEKYCSICSDLVDSSHNCYVQKYKRNPPVHFSIIFYDLECTQNLNIGNDTYLHEPNLCVAHIVCDQCFMIHQSDYCCSVCGNRQHIFENSDEGNCVKKFIDFCELYREKCLTVFCIAHNFKAHDGQFILQELVKRGKNIHPVMGGMKIYKITYDSYINFIDSLNFLPMPLAKFPETFGLENTTKGWYPHYFNTLENYNYVGTVPDRKYFGTNQMTKKELNSFETWYEERSSSSLLYNNREELIKYCIQDVDILRKGCVAFMTNFLSITDINPLLQTFTLPQAVMLAFRKKFLQEHTLSVVPTNLYHESRKTQSKIGLKWLINEKRKCTGNMLYEVNIPSTKYYVDGYCKDTNTVYEFLGCYWHGCESCFKNRTQHLNGGGNDTFQFRYDQTCLRLDFIKNLGYKIVREWECRFRKFLNDSVEIAASLENDSELLHSYLHPRDAIYGGRTEVFQLHYKVREGEKIRYYDFTSLYPFVNKTCKNPIGHPKLYYRDECKNLNISKMDGLIKCSILPPRDLLIPVLPSKINKKLIFTLCRTCAEKENVTEKCPHSGQERMLVGTWVLDEVNLSIKYGYKISEIFEVWEYEISHYSTEEKTGGVFTEYMNCFLKLKQEASDWPADVNSESEKQKFIDDFFTNEGINLDAAAIKKNPSQRGCCKLALNSLWGKFIQNTDKGHTSIIHDVSELYALVFSAGVVISDIICLDEVLWVNWKYVTEDFAEPLKHVSLPIGAFTTANARILLYNELSKIPDKVLYCDTDSIIFVEDESNKGLLKTGNFTGDLTDELSVYGKNAYITEFGSTGPKSYGYIVFDPDRNEYFEIIKCKGITLNDETKQIVNFATLKSLILDSDDEGFRVVRNDKKIKRKKLLKVVTEPELKKFRFTYNKRACQENSKTVPFGV